MQDEYARMIKKFQTQAQDYQLEAEASAKAGDHSNSAHLHSLADQQWRYATDYKNAMVAL